MTIAVGAETADGVFAGLTADGKQAIFAAPADLGTTMTFNEATQAIEEKNKENYLGHNDWQIGARDVMRVLCQNQNEGVLSGTFKTEVRRGPAFPHWYFSYSKPSFVTGIRFLDGSEHYHHKDFLRLSCRPVRLVAVPALP